MARIAGINLPNEKKVGVALTYIFGIGPNLARKILTETKINPDIRAKDLTDDQIDKIKDYIQKNIRVEGDLRMLVTQNIKRLKEIGTLRGYRHSRNLPVRGQRTKTNARTKRGKRVTVGSGRKPAAEKT